MPQYFWYGCAAFWVGEVLFTLSSSELWNRGRLKYLGNVLALLSLILVGLGGTGAIATALFHHVSWPKTVVVPLAIITCVLFASVATALLFLIFDRPWFKSRFHS